MKWKFNQIGSARLYGFCLCLFIAFNFISTNAGAQYTTNTYNGVSYSSSRPYNLNIVYFVPNDVPLDPNYKARVSAYMLWGQNWYKQQMINNGYGSKTFGMFTETANPNRVKLNVIHGAHPLSSYPYTNASLMQAEIAAYYAANPSQKTSEHMLVITAVPSGSGPNVPFYGLGRTCYALDYPQMDLQYMGTSGTYGQQFTGWFGGMMHELGHGLNLSHSAHTLSEYNNPNKGVNLMGYGNQTLGMSPTFINRAGCATLNTCQVFADAPGVTYYNGSISGLTGLHAFYENGDLVVSGTFESNRPVIDVNIYQDPFPTPSPGYHRVAWSVPAAGNTFSVRMPVSDLSITNGQYNLEIELRLNNGEYQSNFTYYPYTYNNGIPEINIDFGIASTCVGGTLKLGAGIQGVAYQWQYLYGGNWYNYPEGNNGYATFSGTHSANMTISNISSLYVNNPNTARVYVTKADGSTYTIGRTWKADGFLVQPPAMTKACVGGSLQIAAQASGIAYEWQYMNPDGSWMPYPEGNLQGYAAFSGTKTPTLTISNIQPVYVNHSSPTRLVVWGGSDGCYTVSNTVNWTAEGIAAQPSANTTTCVGGSLQLSTQASGTAYQWQYYQNGGWYNYPEGYNGYATFTGSQTPAMTISNISSLYVTNPNQARLVVYGNNGCYTVSNTANWKANNCSTMSGKIQMITTQSVYPNPVNDELTIDPGAEDDHYSITIMNSVGQVVYQVAASEKTMKISFRDKAAGIYFVKITGKLSGSANTYRVVKP